MKRRNLMDLFSPGGPKLLLQRTIRLLPLAMELAVLVKQLQLKPKQMMI